MATKLSLVEQAKRRDEALAVVQQYGLPNLIAICRNGDDAAKEKAAEQLSYIAQRDGQCAAAILTVGGIGPLVAMMSAESGLGDDDPNFDMKVIYHTLASLQLSSCLHTTALLSRSIALYTCRRPLSSASTISARGMPLTSGPWLSEVPYLH